MKKFLEKNIKIDKRVNIFIIHSYFLFFSMLALDIWAGSTSFWKNFKALNPQIKTVICWDPIFQRQEYCEENSVLENIGLFLSRFSKILTQNEIQEVVEKSKSGVFKILAKYQDIPLEDESIDILTLNSPHPLMFPWEKWFLEFLRVLKPGWIFYFWHSTDINVDFSQDKMKLLWSWRFLFWDEDVWFLENFDLKFPMSPVIKNNLISNQMIQKWLMKNSSSYIYWKWPTKIKINPNWKAWQKR